jgi:hypothetical protein
MKSVMLQESRDWSGHKALPLKKRMGQNGVAERDAEVFVGSKAGPWTGR